MFEKSFLKKTEVAIRSFESEYRFDETSFHESDMIEMSETIVARIKVTVIQLDLDKGATDM